MLLFTLLQRRHAVGGRHIFLYIDLTTEQRSMECALYRTRMSRDSLASYHSIIG